MKKKKKKTPKWKEQIGKFCSQLTRNWKWRKNFTYFSFGWIEQTSGNKNIYRVEFWKQCQKQRNFMYSMNAYHEIKRKVREREKEKLGFFLFKSFIFFAFLSLSPSYSIIQKGGHSRALVDMYILNFFFTTAFIYFSLESLRSIVHRHK